MPLPPKIQEERENLAKRVVEDIRSGKPFFWDSGHYGRPHRNLVADIQGKESKYHGINAMMLTCAADTFEFKDTRWATFSQVKSLQKEGVPFEKQPHIKKGAKGIPIEYWQYTKAVMEKDPATGKMVPKMELDPETGKMKQAVRRLNPPLVRRYIVFNGDQIANIPPAHAITINEKDRNEAMEAMIKNSEASVKFDQTEMNFYRPSEDCVHVMPREDFKTLGDFYGTVAHEIAHSTGAESRMNREGITHSDGFGGPIYAKEELRAEMTSMFLAQEYGVAPGKEHYENHIAYLQSWADVIEKDPDELFRAAAEAQKMTDYIKDRMIERNLEKERPKEQVQDKTAADECLQKLSVTLDFVEGQVHGDAVVLGGGSRSFSEYTPARVIADKMKPDEEVKELGGHIYHFGKEYCGRELNQLMNDFIKDDTTASLPSGLYNKAGVTIRYNRGEGQEPIVIKDRWDIGDGDTFLLQGKTPNGYTALLEYLKQTQAGRPVAEDKELTQKALSFDKPDFSQNTELYKDMMKLNLMIANDAGERMDKLDIEACKSRKFLETLKKHQYEEVLKSANLANINDRFSQERHTNHNAMQMKALQTIGYEYTAEQKEILEKDIKNWRDQATDLEKRHCGYIQQNMVHLADNTAERSIRQEISRQYQKIDQIVNSAGQQQTETKKRGFKPIHRSIIIPDKKPKRRRVVSRRATDKSKGMSR